MEIQTELGRLARTCWLWIFLCLLPVLADAASFYGNTYISLGLQEARSQTELNFRFKTSRSDALLILAAGKTDYCLVVLQAGALKVRINLGAGEAEVSSPRGLKLDDLLWHDVRITRRDANFTLLVDGLYTTEVRLRGHFYELNIHYGLFLGGLGDFRELFLGLLQNFRGCLEDVHYNGVDVFQRSRERGSHADVYAVTWDCNAPEFDATSEQEISFLEPDSYVALPGLPTGKSNLFLRLGLKTQTKEGLVLYQTGPNTKSDMTAMELAEGHLRVTLDTGAGKGQVVSDVKVNDGAWHDISVQLSTTGLEIVVDGHSNYGRGPTLGRPMEWQGSFYVGGLELSRQARALSQGVRATNASVKGCLRHLEIDHRRMGLKEARVTRHIAPDCLWEYPCVKAPCIEAAVCHQEGSNSFRCECDQLLCMKPEYASTQYGVYTKSNNVTAATSAGNSDNGAELQVLALAPLQVNEGSSAIVTAKQLDVVFNYAKFGIRESGILFHVVHPPQYGKLTSTLWRRADEATFTLLDVHADRLRFAHDGSETTADSIVLELELVPQSGLYLLPAYLQARQRFVLHVAVTPVNDPPDLIIPPGRVLRLARNTKKALTADLLSATDSDTSPADIMYLVINTGKPGDGPENDGHVEHVQKPGTPITSFSQQDISKGLVAYVHRGGLSTKIAFKVSDGVETGPTVILRVAAFELQIWILNNTGLNVPLNSSAALTNSNLTLATNAPDQNLELKIEIIKPPQFGAIQRLKSNMGARWQSINHFTATQLEREKLRYVHLSSTQPSMDEFRFVVSVVDGAPDLKTSPYEFRIQFLTTTIKEVKNDILQIKASNEASVTDRHLRYQTEPVASTDDAILYTIVEPPKYGQLLLVMPAASSASRQKLSKGSHFNQTALANNAVAYRLWKRTLSALHDHFRFQVTTNGVVSPVQRFRIQYTPPPSNIQVILETLEVSEGDSAMILPTHLHISPPGITNVIYNITHPPQHGAVHVYDLNRRQIVRRNATYFTSQEIADHQVDYQHDDSEAARDTVHFTVTSDENDITEQDFLYVGTLHVQIFLKNDNPPVRLVDRAFYVVTNGERLLTGSDIKYGDADSNTRATDIVYTRRGIPNGALFHVDKPETQVFTFTQHDLDDKKILFRHQGALTGRMSIWVSDGQFYTTGSLEVRASEPFVEVVNNTGLVVKRGDLVVISNGNLSVEANWDAGDADIRYDVVEGPAYGLLEASGQRLESFNQDDLRSGKVVYKNDNSVNVKDRLLLRVTAGQAHTSITFTIKIYPDSYWEPLRIVHNRSLHVEESTSVTIDQSALKIMHPHIPPSDITYIVHQPPQYGYLEVDTDEDYDDDVAVTSSQGGGDVEPVHKLPPEVSVFDQALINDRKLHYIQSGPNQTTDYFVMDVTNGIYTLYNLTFHFVVIPKAIYLETKLLDVTEGANVTLKSVDIAINTPYYVDKAEEYLITRSPKAGSLKLMKSNQPVSRFGPRDLANGLVGYFHDGSEGQTDNFEIIATFGEKQSVPATVNIRIRPVDDEQPILVNNTGLLVWEGSVTKLTSSQLAAVDLDSPTSYITFSITPEDCGHTVSILDPKSSLLNFTQAQINQEQVAFSHSGSKNCSLRLMLSDGFNTPSFHSFHIWARPLQLGMKKNSKLHVFPMMQQSITSTHLLTVSNDDQAHNPRYTILKAPKLGRLLLEQTDGSTRSVTNFTQRDLNQSLLIYEHTEPFMDLTVSDSFTFTVSLDKAKTIEQQEFVIEVSVTTMAAGGLDRYLGLKPLQVEEGAQTRLTLNHFNTSGIIHFISSHRGSAEPPKVKLLCSRLPAHGFLSVAGTRLDATQTDIPLLLLQSGQVAYHHDHSDSTVDEIGLSVYLQREDPTATSKPDVLLYNGTLRVNILPINDEPFILITKSPNMQVVQRQFRLITPEFLLTEDPDTLPRDIQYDIIDGPSTGGKIAFSENLAQSISHFTQDDINKQRLVFLHDGTLQNISFYFRVWDGKFNPVSSVFNVHIVPLTLSMTNNTLIPILQGGTVTMIKNASMGADTNGQRKHVFYNITQEPQHGRIYVKETLVSTFGQSNIDKEEVLYVQFNMSASSDSFQVTVFNLELSIPNQEFNICVKPLVRQYKPRIYAGDKLPINLAILDASPLAELTSGNPSYVVTRKPRYGRLRKIIPTSANRNKRQAKEKDVTRFTHEDVQSGFIHYISKRMELNETLEENFEFELSADKVQPAKGLVEISVVPPGGILQNTAQVTTMGTVIAHGATGTNTGSRRKTSAGSDGGVDVATGEASHPNPGSPSSTTTNHGSSNSNNYNSLSSDLIMIVGIVAGVLLLAIIIIVTVKCRVQHRPLDKNSPGRGRGAGEEDDKPSNGHLAALAELDMIHSFGTMEKKRRRSLSQAQESELMGSDLEVPLPGRHPPTSPRPPRANANMNLRTGYNTTSSQGSSTVSFLRSSWHEQRDTPPSVPQCKVIPLAETEFVRESPDVAAGPSRYPYGPPDDTSLDEWGVPVDPDSRYAPRTTNPMLRKNQYWV